MARKPAFDLTAEKINQRRGENWEEHYEFRRFALTHPRREEIGRAVATLPRPSLGVTGGAVVCGKAWAACSTHDAAQFLEIGKLYGVSYWMLLWWYWTTEGWQEFNDLWANLPEVVHIPLCTTGEVVHICTQGEYVHSVYEP